MFSFHKPKVYRSTSGCCICKAKSSSSRFTDSRKYEEDLMECFQLGERRTGEICNACVLLVKRWKKLPEGCGRHWRHVVDYRAGPGSKSLVRAKTRNKKRPKLKAEVRAVSPGADDDISSDLSVLSVLTGPVSPTTAPNWTRKPKLSDGLSSRNTDTSELVDFNYWKRKKVCCGVIFVAPGGMVMVEPRLMKRCRGSCSSSPSPPPALTDDEVTAIPPAMDGEMDGAAAAGKAAAEGDGATTPVTPISDSSSDSGYDDSSNPTAN